MQIRADVNYSFASVLVSKRYVNPNYPLSRLGDLVIQVQYGTSSPASDKPEGLPILRMNNLQDDGWDLQDLKYIELSDKEIELYSLDNGDILFNRTNSKELVGKCGVFRESGQWLFASYLIRVKLNRSQALPDFISTFLYTKAGRLQIDRVSRQIIGMTNINSEEIKDLIIPLPPIEIQKSLVAEIEAARQSKKQKLAKAEELLSSIDSFLLNELGLTLPEKNEQQVYAVKLQSICGQRLDAPAYQPIYAKGKKPRTTTRSLNQLAYINHHSVFKPDNDNELVPYIGLPECSQTEIEKIVTRPYIQVKGRAIVKPGDILFARIEPSVFNKKYVLVETLENNHHAYTSTEFYVVTIKPNEIERDYLYSMFFCSFVFNQVNGKKNYPQKER